MGTNVVDDPTSSTPPGLARRHQRGAGTGEGPHRFIVETMLELLIARPDVAVSDEPVILGNETTICRHFFTRLAATTEAHLGRLGGYWGPTDSIRSGWAYSWINTPGGEPDIRVSGEARKKVRAVEDVLGETAILIIGTPTRTDAGAIEIRTADAHAIALSGLGRRKA